MPDIEFVNSPRSEEKRWKWTGKLLTSGWYKNHGFLIVPELRDDVSRQIQVVYPREFKYEVVETETFKEGWERVEDGFWVELAHYLPEARKMHTNVRVDVGSIGTISSSYWSAGHYYLRRDRSVADLAAMIINHVLYVGRKNLGVTWSKREALMDFIMTRPAMKKLFPQFDPVFTQLARVSASARRESEQYLRELGVSDPKVEFEIDKMRISKLEKKIMKQLIAHQGELVSYDELADSIWGEGEFKTFWAINKLVERLRIKLDKLGIEGERIEAVRGQGYLLK